MFFTLSDIKELIREWWRELEGKEIRARQATPEPKQSSVEISGTLNGMKITAKSFAVTVGDAGLAAQVEILRLAGIPALKADGKTVKGSE